MNELISPYVFLDCLIYDLDSTTHATSLSVPISVMKIKLVTKQGTSKNNTNVKD